MTTGSQNPSEARTFPQLVQAAAAAYGEAPAISLRNPDNPEQTLSFGDSDTQSAELARGLLARSVGKGTLISFHWRNDPLFAAALGAVGRIGAVAMPISTLIKADELVRVPA